MEISNISSREELAESEHRARSIVESAPFPIGVYTGKEMRIQFANQAILDVWGKGNDVIGKLYSEVLPELDNQEIFAQLDQVFITGVPFHARNQRVDLLIDGKMQSFYFNYSFTPLYDLAGNIYGVMNTAAEVTDVVVSKQQAEQSKQTLHNMILQAPVAMCIMLGPDHTVEVANDLIIELWGKPAEEVLGKPIFEGLPDAKGQGLEQLLADVYETGISFKATEQPVSLLRNGQLEVIYQNFVYEPYKDTEGNILGVIAITTDVTEQVLANAALQKSYEELQILNEELANSESRFKNLVKNAPVGIAIFNGRDLIIDAANNQMLTFWGKDNRVNGMRLDEALPELKDQPFLTLLDNVFSTGEIYYGIEAFSMLEHNGVLKEGYHDFIYQPIKDEAGTTKNIMLVAIDVTERVLARKKVEHAEEMLRFAIEAANVGTWFINAKTREFVPSPKLKEFFGYNQDEEMPYEAAIDQIHEDFRDKVIEEVEAAITHHKHYSIEYPIIGYRDQRLRWVKAFGKLYDHQESDLSHFSGVMIDITEQKQDEIRKNDFIGMVSHELKTPLTTLTAIIQVLNKKLSGNDDPFVPGAIERANTQVKKMGTMINGFLNLSRLESGKILIEKEIFELDQLINEVIEETKSTTSTHTFNFIKCDPVEVCADRGKIASVVSNLLSNAIKYSPASKNIEVRCETKYESVLVSVKDEGIGIKSQDKEKLFDRYYRVANKDTTHISGFGIGLYLCAEIINHHKGKIWVDGEEGKGSTFYFELPIES